MKNQSRSERPGRTMLISEPIEPASPSFDLARMGRGEPGLPCGFIRQSRPVTIVEVLSAWKHSEPEGGTGRLYLRRHYYRLRMDDASIWTVYFIRQTPRSGKPGQRWFLYTIERTTDDSTI